MARSIVGYLVGKRGIVYAPVNRAGVLLVFARLLDEFDMLVEESAADCGYVVVLRRLNDAKEASSRWERVRIALAYASSELEERLKDQADEMADLLICWYHDWPDCPLETFELSAHFAEPAEPASARKTAATTRPLLPSGAADLLRNRGAIHERYQKAIAELDEKIRRFDQGPIRT